ncbi:hypothetical protein [Nostoc sp.]|uniref:hypothetical protein n=1 Tax=Nostoc sp. TaxID=1180 RepID=UPI002FF1CD31
MSNFPPERIEDALKFCCCSPYQNRQICIYAGGGNRTQHDMYWAYAIYDADGDRLAYSNLSNCLDVDDGLRFCEALIDRWDAPLSYEDVRLWRDICEYLNRWRIPLPSHLIMFRIPGCNYLVGYDRTHRQKLWDKYKIQLITYEKFSRKYEGWRLKGNWEDKIDFLEQIYILGRDPDTLPRPWLDKWERKQQSKKYQELADDLKALEKKLNLVHDCQQWALKGIVDYFAEDQRVVKDILKDIGYCCGDARKSLSKLLRRNEPD